MTQKTFDSFAFTLFLSASLLAPNVVLAKDDVPPASNIKLTPEHAEVAPVGTPVTAPVPAPVMAPIAKPFVAPVPSQSSSGTQASTVPASNFIHETPMLGYPAPNPVPYEGQPYSPPDVNRFDYERPNYRAFSYPRSNFYPNTGQRSYGEQYTAPGYYPSGSPDYQGATTYYEPHPMSNYSQGVVCIPQGMILPIDLRTAISTQVAKAGDFIEATINANVPLNNMTYLPAGSVVSGEVTEAKAGRRLSRSGSLSIEFNNLRLPSGASFPMQAKLVGNIGRYKDVNGVERGEGWKAKVGQFALRGLGGAGLGAALGTGLGAVVDGGHGAGTGAWAGAAFGGGLGAMDMFLRKGRDVIIPSGTEMKLQMEQPLAFPPGVKPA